MKVLTFLTDFGSSRGYAAQMKGIALSLCEARIVDITHEITAHNIREGAFVLRCAVPFFPIGSVHVGVVDPGVGTQRRGLVVTTKRAVLIGPDNGLLLPAARSLGDPVYYEITNKKLMSHPVSDTFHGRDIFTVVAAHLLNGVAFEEVGPRVFDVVDLDFGEPFIDEKEVSGRVIFCDRFGNIITNIPFELLKNKIDFDRDVTVFIDGQMVKMPFVRSYGLVKPEQVLLTVGSSGFVEIGVNQGNAKKHFSVKVNDEVRLVFG